MGCTDTTKYDNPSKAWIFRYPSAEDRGRGLSVLGGYWLAHGVFSLFRQSYTPIRLLGEGVYASSLLIIAMGKWGMCDGEYAMIHGNTTMIERDQ